MKKQEAQPLLCGTSHCRMQPRVSVHWDYLYITKTLSRRIKIDLYAYETVFVTGYTRTFLIPLIRVCFMSCSSVGA
jgi:hypothetical protein